MTVRKHLRHWEIAGFLVVGAGGVLLHALFEWTGGNALAAAVSGVNESTWEHMKLLFVPYFVFTMAEFPAFAEPFRNYFAAKAAAGLVGLLLIPLFYYVIAGMFGAPPMWVNILNFFVSAAVMYLVSYRLLTGGALRGGLLQLAGFALLWALAFAFAYFTYRTPHLPLFRDPTTFVYGIPR